MFSLRTFHLVFILIAMVMADMFGAWGVWDHSRTHDPITLLWGVLSFLAGFALIGYAIWVVRKFDRAKIECTSAQLRVSTAQSCVQIAV